MSTSGSTVLPQLTIGHLEPQLATERTHPAAASNVVTLPRLSDHRRPARGAHCGAALATRTPRNKGCLSDRQNNEIDIAFDDVEMPLSPNGMAQTLPLSGYLHVKLKHACNCPKLPKTARPAFCSFGQLPATGMRVASTGRQCVSQSDVAVLAYYYAYHKSPVAYKPGHVVDYGTKGAKVVCLFVANYM